MTENEDRKRQLEEITERIEKEIEELEMKTEPLFIQLDEINKEIDDLYEVYGEFVDELEEIAFAESREKLKENPEFDSDQNFEYAIKEEILFKDESLHFEGKLTEWMDKLLFQKIQQDFNRGFLHTFESFGVVRKTLEEELRKKSKDSFGEME